MIFIQHIALFIRQDYIPGVIWTKGSGPFGLAVLISYSELSSVMSSSALFSSNGVTPITS